MTYQPPQPPEQTPPPAGPPAQPGQWTPPPNQQYAPPPAPQAPQAPQGPPPQQWQATPPPPPGAPQPGFPPPPPGAPGSPYGAPAAKPAIDLKAVNPFDLGILGAGVLAFLFSFFPYYTVSYSFGSFASGSVSASAWHGFFGWFAALVALAAAALLAVTLFVPTVTIPVPARLVTVGGFALATLGVILALFVFPGDTSDIDGFDTGHGFGYWVSLIVIIAGLVLSVLRLKGTGGSLPWEKKGPTPPPPGAFGGQPGQYNPPSGGYQPPPAPGQYPQQ